MRPLLFVPGSKLASCQTVQSARKTRALDTREAMIAEGSPRPSPFRTSATTLPLIAGRSSLS